MEFIPINKTCVTKYNSNQRPSIPLRISMSISKLLLRNSTFIQEYQDIHSYKPKNMYTNVHALTFCPEYSN